MQKRNSTVYNYSPYTVGKLYPARPQIIMQGRWLEELGFLIGEKVTLSCEEGRIVIEKASAFTNAPQNMGEGMVAETGSYSYGEGQERMADLKTALSKTFALESEIKTLFAAAAFDGYDDLSALSIDDTDSDQLFLLDELQEIMVKLVVSSNL